MVLTTPIKLHEKHFFFPETVEESRKRTLTSNHHPKKERVRKRAERRKKHIERKREKWRRSGRVNTIKTRSCKIHAFMPLGLHTYHHHTVSLSSLFLYRRHTVSLSLEPKSGVFLFVKPRTSTSYQIWFLDSGDTRGFNVHLTARSLTVRFWRVNVVDRLFYRATSWLLTQSLLSPWL